MKKKILSIILAALILVSVLPMPALAVIEMETVGAEAATCTQPGHLTYYVINGYYFSDEACEYSIEDIDAWLAEGGDGYIAPLGHVWGFSAEGDTITAVCGRADCGQTETATLVLADEPVRYDGTAKTPVTVQYSDGFPVKDLTVSYENNTLPGDASASVSMHDEVTAVKAFTIEKGVLTADDFELTPPESLTYDGTAKTLKVLPVSSVSGIGNCGIILKCGEEITTEAINVGAYDVYVTVEASEYYAALGETKVGSFTIVKANWTGVMDYAFGRILGEVGAMAHIELPEIPSGAAYGTPTNVPVGLNASIADGVLNLTVLSEQTKETKLMTVPVIGDDFHNGYDIDVYLEVSDVWNDFDYALAEGYSYLFSEDHLYFTISDEGGVHTVTLKRDLTAGSSSASVQSPSSVVLDLNGHTINGNKNRIFYINGGSLTVRDSSDAKTGKLTGGDADRNSGGAVYVTYGGTFTLESGSITDCSADLGGGAVFVNSGTFNMTGGSITDCDTWYNGFGGGGVYINRGTFNMSGGEISGNMAHNNGSGGGVDIENGAAFNMTGGTITNNAADNYYGGGVKVSGSMTVGGTAVITGNFRGSSGTLTGNLSLGSNATLTVGEPADGMQVGITLNNSTGNFGAFTDACADLTEYFFADAGDRAVQYRDGKMEMTVAAPEAGEGYTVDFKAEQIVIADGYELCLAAGADAAKETLTDGRYDIEPEGEYYVRKAAAGDHAVSPSTKYTAPARPAPPTEAPTLIDQKAISLTVETESGREYKLGDGEWQESGEFSGLTPETAYSICARIAATDSSFASEASAALNVKTNRALTMTAREGVENSLVIRVVSVSDVALNIFAASYDENGKMLSVDVKSVNIEGGEITNYFDEFTVDPDCSTWRVFALDSEYMPVLSV